MSLVKINVHPRSTTGKNENRRTRVAGHIPAVLYGHDRAATAVQLETREFTRALQKAHGRTVIWDLQLEDQGDQPLALMRELQQHPVTDEILHVDLFEIPRGVPVTVDVALVLKGEPSCVKFAEGEVLQLLDSVELSCQPRELPDAIEVDVSELALNAKLFVKDLSVPVGKVMNDPETQVLVVKPVSLFVEEEPAADAAAAEGEQSDEEKSDD
jgi:large subunit ribosomal protein L25